MGVREMANIFVYMSPFNLRSNFDVALNMFMSMSDAFKDERSVYCYNSLKDVIRRYDSQSTNRTYRTDIVDEIHHCKKVLMKNYKPMNGINLESCIDTFNDVSVKVKELSALSGHKLEGYKYDWTLTTLVYPVLLLDLSLGKREISEEMGKFLLRRDEPTLSHGFLEVLQKRLNELSSVEIALLAESVQRERAELAALERNRVLLQASNLIGALSKGEDVRTSVKDFNKKIEDILGVLERL